MLALAFDSHDPTRPPYTAQYASLALAHDEKQLAAAQSVVESVEVRSGRKLVTRVEPLRRFYLAEDYHQKYYLRQDRVLSADVRVMFGTSEDAFRESTAAARVNGYVAGDGTRARLDAEIDSLGLSADGSAHLVSRVGDAAPRIGCSLRPR